jgi:hypothetical protein
MRNLDAFCTLLKDLNARLVVDGPSVEEPHAYAIRMVRAGILRAAIGTVMACLDPADQKRLNRPSVGEIFGLLAAALQPLRELHKSLRKDPSFERVKRLRDDVAHNLVREDVQTPVEYEDVYKLTERAEQIVVELFAACGRGTPEFLDYHGPTAKHAKIFWDTCFFGTGSPGSAPEPHSADASQPATDRQNRRKALTGGRSRKLKSFAPFGGPQPLRLLSASRPSSPGEAVLSHPTHSNRVLARLKSHHPSQKVDLLASAVAVNSRAT